MEKDRGRKVRYTKDVSRSTRCYVKEGRRRRTLDGRRRLRREGEIWEIVNRKRRERKRINESIGWEEWKEHFMRLLGEWRREW